MNQRTIIKLELENCSRITLMMVKDMKIEECLESICEKLDFQHPNHYSLYHHKSEDTNPIYLEPNKTMIYYDIQNRVKEFFFFFFFFI